MKTIADYQGLITWQYADKPDFRQVVGDQTQPHVDEQSFFASLPAAFDLDDAIGAQLDFVGEWVGVSRRLPIAVANLYFSLDVRGAGLDEGYWKGPYDQGVTIQLLDDDTYRRLLRARILANHGKATPADAQAILSCFFDGSATHNGVSTSIIVQDNAFVATTQAFISLDDPDRGLDSAAIWYQAGLAGATLTKVDMSVTIGVSGAQPSTLDLQILVQDLIPVISSGVRKDIVVTSVDGAPLFGLDVENEYVSGLDVGAMGVAPADLANLVYGDFNTTGFGSAFG